MTENIQNDATPAEPTAEEAIEQSRAMLTELLDGTDPIMVLDAVIAPLIEILLPGVLPTDIDLSSLGQQAASKIDGLNTAMLAQQADYEQRLAEKQAFANQLNGIIATRDERIRSFRNIDDVLAGTQADLEEARRNLANRNAENDELRQKVAEQQAEYANLEARFQRFGVQAARPVEHTHCDSTIEIELDKSFVLWMVANALKDAGMKKKQRAEYIKRVSKVIGGRRIRTPRTKASQVIV